MMADNRKEGSAVQYKPILFNTEMVRAILAGKKIATRRIITPQPKARLCFAMAGTNCGKWHYPSESAQKSWGEAFRIPTDISLEERERSWNPPAHADDVLWVRETWSTTEKCGLYPNWLSTWTLHYVYKADDPNCDAARKARWYPSIHMPKAAARIFLRVVDVRVERLQEITVEGCAAEGIWDDYKTHSDKYHENLKKAAYPKAFSELWDSTIKKDSLSRYGWNANPWVWAITFGQCEKPERWPVL